MLSPLPLLPWISGIPLRPLLIVAINGLILNGREDLLPGRITPIIPCSSARSIQLFSLLRKRNSIAKSADVAVLLETGADNRYNRTNRKRKWNALGLALRLQRLDLFHLIHLQNTQTLPVYPPTDRIVCIKSLISTGNKQLIEMAALTDPKAVGWLYVNGQAFHKLTIAELFSLVPKENDQRLALALLNAIADSPEKSEFQSILQTVMELFHQREEIREWWLQNRLALIAKYIHSENWINLIVQLDAIITDKPLPCEVVLEHWESLSGWPLCRSSWSESYSDNRKELLFSRVAPSERLSMIFKVLEHPNLNNNLKLVWCALGIDRFPYSGSKPGSFTEIALSQQNERGEVPYITAARCGAAGALSYLWKPHVGAYQDSNGNTALMAATKAIIESQKSDLTILKQIAHFNLDNAFIIPDSEGLTPLHRSILANRDDIVRLIMTELRNRYPEEYKMALNQKAIIPGHKRKRTALEMAKKLNLTEVMQIIIPLGLGSLTSTAKNVMIP